MRHMLLHPFFKVVLYKFRLKNTEQPFVRPLLSLLYQKQNLGKKVFSYEVEKVKKIELSSVSRLKV